MEKRDYYTFEELFFGLKDYFSEGNNILHQLHDLIDINSDVPYKTHIYIDQKTATNFMGDTIKYNDNYDYTGTIYLRVYKSGFSPAKAIRQHQTMFLEKKDPRYSIDNADFIIKVENGEISFPRRYKHNIPKTYRPVLKVKDTKKFVELYQRLLDEGYLTYPDIMYFFPDKQDGTSTHITLGTNAIGLESVDFIHSNILDRALIFRYNFYDNKIYYRDWRKNTKSTVKDLVHVKIKKENIYKGYIPYIEEYTNRQQELKLPTDKKGIRRLVLSNGDQAKRTN